MSFVCHQPLVQAMSSLRQNISKPNGIFSQNVQLPGESGERERLNRMLRCMYVKCVLVGASILP